MDNIYNYTTKYLCGQSDAHRIQKKDSLLQAIVESVSKKFD